jgi:hypothetical protein
MARRDTPQDLISVDECSQAITHALNYVKEKLDVCDQNFLKGIMKFAERVTKMPTSKLTTSFHSFGTQAVLNTRLTTTPVVKKRKKGKIHVQSESVKRRKMARGSKASQSKGQNCKNNPFQKEAGKRKRLHQFGENVRRNEPVAKKSGRTMATKTRLYGP